MSRPAKPSGLADGEPLVGELVAVIDETIPEVGAGVHYVLRTAVTLSPVDVDRALSELFANTPHHRPRRRRPQPRPDRRPTDASLHSLRASKRSDAEIADTIEQRINGDLNQ